jgi:hypothetical protein
LWLKHTTASLSPSSSVAGQSYCAAPLVVALLGELPLCVVCRDGWHIQLGSTAGAFLAPAVTPWLSSSPLAPASMLHTVHTPGLVGSAGPSSCLGAYAARSARPHLQRMHGTAPSVASGCARWGVWPAACRQAAAECWASFQCMLGVPCVAAAGDRPAADACLDLRRNSFCGHACPGRTHLLTQLS